MWLQTLSMRVCLCVCLSVSVRVSEAPEFLWAAVTVHCVNCQRQTLISYGSGGRSPNWRHQQTQCLMRAHFLVHREPPSCSVPTGWKGWGGFLGSPIRALIPAWGPHLHDRINLQRSNLQIPSHWIFNFNIRICEDTNIPSVARYGLLVSKDISFQTQLI